MRVLLSLLVVVYSKEFTTIVHVPTHNVKRHEMSFFEVQFIF